jgi:aspartyl aminopeptidase
MICATHSDSPAFKIKENAENAGRHYVRLNTEKYGGMLCAGWLDRPLAAAGHLAVRTGNGVDTVLVDTERPVALIPSLAIHMNRKANEAASYDARVDMVPLYGQAQAAGSFDALLAEAAGVSPDDILGRDVLLYAPEEGCVWGADDAFISAPRLDDLQNVFASVTALLSAEASDSLSVCAVFDNEEVGSRTRQGAASGFMRDTLERVCDACGLDMRRVVANSFVLSADNGHALHPNHPEMADPDAAPVMNGGVVVKFNANRRYTTDGLSAGVFRKICDKAGVPVQTYYNRADIPGGTTLGCVSLSQVAVPSVDIGLAQLAMHSCYETAGVKDAEYLADAMTAYYSTELGVIEDGYTI